MQKKKTKREEAKENFNRIVWELLHYFDCFLSGKYKVLIRAIKDNDIKAVQYIFHSNPELISIRTYGGKNLLMYSLEKCKGDEVPLYLSLYLEYPYDIPYWDRDHDGYTAYEYALKFKRSQEIIDRIIENSGNGFFYSKKSDASKNFTMMTYAPDKREKTFPF